MLHMVAKLHYEANMSQIAIARRLGVSTATVSRLLQRARTEGIVRIEVLDQASPEELTHQLRDQLGLKRVAIVEAPVAGPLAALSAPLGTLLEDAGLRPGAVIAIGWGRTIREVIGMGLPRIPDVLTVAATGGMQQIAPHFQINEFVRLAAEKMGGRPNFIHAPYLPSASARAAFLSDTAIRDSVALWDRAEVAIVGIGLRHSINPPEASAATLSEQELLDATGDVLRHYYDSAGNILQWEGEGRMIAMSPEQLRSTPLVIGVAATPDKATAIIGAVRAGLVNALVTDTATAQEIVASLAVG